MTLFALTPFIVGAIVEVSRFILHMAQAFRTSDLFSSGESLKPVEFLRKLIVSLIF